MKKFLKIILVLAIAIGWMYIIFKLSSMNSSNSNGKSTGLIALFIEDTLNVTNEYGVTDSHPDDNKLVKASNLINAPMRKVMHASVYFVLSIFLMILFSIIFDHKHFWISIILSLIFCIIFAMTDEYHQLFVSGRTGQIKDAIIDSIGTVAGLIFCSTYEFTYHMGYKKALKEK